MHRYVEGLPLVGRRERTVSDGRGRRTGHFNVAAIGIRVRGFRYSLYATVI